MTSDALSHLDAQGHARMVDVSDKDVTQREATARGRVVMEPSTLALIVEGRLPKGDVLATARIAGIMAAHPRADPALPPAPHLRRRGEPRTVR